MNGADARASLHRDNGLGDQRHVNDHAIATPYTLRLERIGELTHVLMELCVGQLAYVAGLAFENDGNLVAAARQVHIQTIVRDVQLAVGKPAEVGRARVIQRHGKRLFPIDLSHGQIRPEAYIVAGRLVMKTLQFGGLERGLFCKRAGRRKYTVLLQDRLNIFVRHGHSRLMQRWRYGAPAVVKYSRIHGRQKKN
jgi:hypothetical protein